MRSTRRLLASEILERTADGQLAQQILEWHGLGLGLRKIAVLVEDRFGVSFSYVTIGRWVKEHEPTSSERVA